MDIPVEMRFTKEHEWVRQAGDLVVCGITEFAQKELGDIIFIELPEVGKKVAKGDSICVVESTKAASDVYAPVGGVVAEVNQNLRDQPELVNKSPFQDGWLVKLAQVEGSQLDQLMDSVQYQDFAR